jgi:GH35 family endo-1,4-beta-xylanase
MNRLQTLLVVHVLVLSSASRLCGEELDIQASIGRHRMGTLIVQAAPGADVHVEQLRHEFWFGAAIASQVFGSRMPDEDARKYKQVFLENFNAGVTENAVKWLSMERERGRVDYSSVDAILEWADRNEIPVRGHCLFWGIPDRVQPWLKTMDDEELRETVRQRAIGMAQRYRGRFAEYDLNNEMIHGNYYQDRLGAEITRQMADWVHQGDPDATLFLNDYDILTGNRLEDYARQIRALLDSGTAIGGIGVQGHLHGTSFDPAALKHALDTLAAFDLPIRVTEFNIPGQRSPYYKDRRLTLSEAEEEQKAESLAKYYEICFAHPAVEGIMMWGFWEGANWIPVSSLYRRDWTPTPAARAYRDLVFDRWWTKFDGRADSKGRCEVPAFFGKHRVTVGGLTRTVELRKNDGKLTIDFAQRKE